MASGRCLPTPKSSKSPATPTPKRHAVASSKPPTSAARPTILPSESSFKWLKAQTAPYGADGAHASPASSVEAVDPGVPRPASHIPRTPRHLRTHRARSRRESAFDSRRGRMLTSGAGSVRKSYMREVNVGDKLDQYQLTELIARSGMASIFKAVDQLNGHTVAIKIPYAQFESDVVFYGRFQR